jgi:hypothetical protein
VRTAPVPATTATQKDDHAGLSLDLGVSGPRRSHIAERIAVPELAGMSGWLVAHALTGRELDEDIWPQLKALPGLIDYPQPDRDIYWSESTVTTMPAGGSAREQQGHSPCPLPCAVSRPMS